MAMNLSKGQEVSISHKQAKLSKIIVGLGWDNLTENYAGLTALHFGDLFYRDGEWKFNAIGWGTTDGSIAEFARRFQ